MTPCSYQLPVTMEVQMGICSSSFQESVAGCYSDKQVGLLGIRTKHQRKLFQNGLCAYINMQSRSSLSAQAAGFLFLEQHRSPYILFQQVQPGLYCLSFLTHSVLCASAGSFTSELDDYIFCGLLQLESVGKCTLLEKALGDLMRLK